MSPTYILIHAFGTLRDELDRSDRGKRTYSGWLRQFVEDTPKRLTEIAWLIDVLTENGWRVTGSPYDCDVMLEKAVSREVAEQELRRAEVWDRVVVVASPATLVVGGIKVALITTAAGLIIAIPVNIGYNFFVTRIDKLIEDMEMGAAAVLQIVWEREKPGAARFGTQPVPSE